MTSPAPEQRAQAKVRIYLFTYFIVGMIFVQIDKASIGFAALTMRKELALSATLFGFAAGIFSFASFLMQVPAGLLFEKLGARRWMTGITVAWGLVCIAQAFVTTGTQLTVLRFLLGAFEAGFLPGLFVLVSIWFRGRNHGVAVACVQIGTAAAGVIGGPLAGWILGQTLLGLSGWRALFLIEGAMTVVFALFALRVVTDTPARAGWLAPDERAAMERHLAANQAAKETDKTVGATRIRDVLKDRRILLLTLSYACSGWAAGTFVFFTPTLLKAAGQGLDVMTVGLLSAVPYVVNMIVAFTWGAHADRHNERHWHTVLPLVVSMSGILLYPMASSAALALLALVLVQAGNTGLYVNFWATCTMIAGRQSVARSTAIINSGSAAATFVAPTVFGWALDLTGSSTTGLFICGGIMLLNFVLLNLFFFARKRTGNGAGSRTAEVSARS